MSDIVLAEPFDWRCRDQLMSAEAKTRPISRRHQVGQNGPFRGENAFLEGAEKYFFESGIFGSLNRCHCLRFTGWGLFFVR